MKLTVAVSGLALLLSTAAAVAQPVPIGEKPSDGVARMLREGVVPPVLQYLMDSGVSLTYLGDAGGLHGYLGESPTGVVQTFYLTPDERHVVAGVLFRDGGVLTTGVQVSEMKRRIEKEKELAEGAAETVADFKPGSAAPAVQFGGLIEVDAEEVRVGEVAAPSRTAYLSNRDAEAFKADVEASGWFSVGVPEAPVVYMLADPTCPHCHNAWQKLRPMVIAKEVTIRVIMAAARPGSEAAAISILSREEPSRVWFAGEGSVKGHPIKDPPPEGSEEYNEGLTYLRANHQFIAKHELDATPYFFAFAPDGELYESRGWPRDEQIFWDIVKGN